MNEEAGSLYCTWYNMDAVHTVVKIRDSSEHSGIFGQHRSVVVRSIVLLQTCRDVHMFSISGRNVSPFQVIVSISLLLE